MKTIIEMAREAGWKDLRDYDSEMHEDIFMGSVDSLKAFAALVAAKEREACMKESDKLHNRFVHLLQPPIVVAVGCFLLAYVVGWV